MELRRIQFLSCGGGKVIHTNRLNIYPMTNEQMKRLILEQTIPELKEAYEEMLQCCIDNPDQREWFAVWNIELNDDSQISVGTLSFKGLGDDGILEIGYGANSGFENRGYMTEAVCAIVKWAAIQDGVQMIEAETEMNNTASKRVLEKAGFVANGKMGEEGPRFVWKE